MEDICSSSGDNIDIQGTHILAEKIKCQVAGSKHIDDFLIMHIN